MTIHTEHPFADPPSERDPVRRFRGRVGAVVSLWTSGGGADRAGLTVSSYAVANGEPAHLLGLVDPDSDLALAAEETGRVVVQLLEWRHRMLAEAFAGLAPAPGGLFARSSSGSESWQQTDWGPVLTDASAWVGLRLVDRRAVGWSLLLDGVVERVELNEERSPLVHRRGRFQRPD